jgi:hypothetical protein
MQQHSTDSTPHISRQGATPPATTDNFSYKDFIEKIPFLVYFHLDLSDSSFKATIVNLSLVLPPLG